MDNKQIFLPVLGQVLLTLIVWLSLGTSRIRAIRRARVNPQVIADPTRFDEVLQGLENLSDNFENLFEVPTLFFVAAIVIFVQGLSDSFYFAAAWVFVALRCLHSYIHCTYNGVVHRFYVYLLSSMVVWVMWARIGYQLIR